MLVCLTAWRVARPDDCQGAIYPDLDKGLDSPQPTQIPSHCSLTAADCQGAKALDRDFATRLQYVGVPAL
jgi:hypothetical protein